MNNKNYLYFIFTVTLSLFCVILTNYLVDPYGRYGTDILDMNRIDARSAIVNKMHRQLEPPELLLFGSSRCLGLRTRFIESYRGLNVALYAGAIEDHYAILKYAIEELKYPVKVVVLGLEPDLMVNTHPIDKMLVKHPKLNIWLNKEVKKGFQSFFEEPDYIKELSILLSITTLKDSVKLIFHFIMRNMGVREASADNGRVDDNPNASIVQKIVTEKDSIRARLRQFKKLYIGAVQMDKERIEYLNNFAQYTKELGIRVIVFHPGYSFEFWDEMNTIESFKNMHKLIEELFTTFIKDYQWEVIDFRPSNWEGKKLEFFDGVHPTRKTNRILTDAIEQVINSGL